MIKDKNYWTNTINTLIESKTESNDCDFKSDISDNTDKLKEHINAFGNTLNGGSIVFGIDDKDYSYTGNNLDFSKIENRISNITHSSQEPILGIDAFVIDSIVGKLLCLYIHEGVTKPVFIKDRAPLGGNACFKRLGANTIPMPIEELRSLLSQSSRNYYDETLVEDIEIVDLDFIKISKVIQNIEHENIQNNIPILLDNRIIMGFGGSYKPTLAGYLIFGKDAQISQNRKFNNAVIEFQQFRDSTRANPIKKTVISGSLLAQAESAINLLMQHLWVMPVIKNGKREEIPSYNEDIVREIITNAIVHRDYTLIYQPVKIALFKDRVEIENPGGLLPGLTPLNFMHKRNWRNPLMANLIKKAGYGEMDGQGIDRIYEISRQIHVPMPMFKDNKNSFVAILSGPKIYDELLPEQKRSSVIILLIIEKSVDNELIRSYFNISAEQAGTLLKSMASEGVIETVTRSRKFATYQLTSKYLDLVN